MREPHRTTLRGLPLDALGRLASLAQLERKIDRTRGQQEEMYELMALQTQLEAAADQFLALGRVGRPRASSYPILSRAAMAERRSREVCMSHLLDEFSTDSVPGTRKHRPGPRYRLAAS